MNIKIETETINPLLGRKELTVKIDNQGATPTNAEFITTLSSAIKADSSLIVVDKIAQTFGSQKSMAHVKVYDSEEAKLKVEPQPKKKEDAEATDSNLPDASGEMRVQVDAPADEAPKEEEKPEEKPEEPAKEEAPAEEKKKEASE